MKINIICMEKFKEICDIMITVLANQFDYKNRRKSLTIIILSDRLGQCVIVCIKMNLKGDLCCTTQRTQLLLWEQNRL